MPTPPLPVTTIRPRSIAEGCPSNGPPSTVEGTWARRGTSTSRTPTGAAGACSAATTRRTTPRRAACRAPSARGPRALRLRARRRRDRRRAGRRATAAARRSTPGRPSCDDGLDSGSSHHPVIAALVDAGPRHGMPLDLMPRYMDAMRADCEPSRSASRARTQLERYMEGTGDGRPDRRPAARRAARRRRRARAPRRRLPADEPDPRRRRGLGDGAVYLPGLQRGRPRSGAPRPHRLREHVADPGRPRA